MAPDAPPEVGRRLRELRGQRHLTLRGLAERSGLSLNAVSLIERGQTSPTVSSLHRLAAAMEVSITEFFGPPQHESVIFVPAHRRGQTRTEGALIESLGRGLSGQRIEPLLVILQPGAGSGSEPIVHAGQEFAFGLSGRTEYNVNGHCYHLDPGDALLFEATLPHRWHNPTQEEARLLLVLETPQPGMGQFLPHLEHAAEAEEPPLPEDEREV